MLSHHTVASCHLSLSLSLSLSPLYLISLSSLSISSLSHRPLQVIEYIRSCTYTFGKAKIVLKDNRFFIESRHQDILRELLKNPVIRNARIEIAAPSLDPVSYPINGGGGGGRNNPAALDSVTQHTGNEEGEGDEGNDDALGTCAYDDVVFLSLWDIIVIIHHSHYHDHHSSLS